MIESKEKGFIKLKSPKDIVAPMFINGEIPDIETPLELVIAERNFDGEEIEITFKLQPNAS